MTTETLYAVHAVGPDELHPAKSFVEGVRAAHKMNTWAMRTNPPTDDGEWVTLWFNVIEWPYDAEAWADYIANREPDSIFADEGFAHPFGQHSKQTQREGT